MSDISVILGLAILKARYIQGFKIPVFKHARYNYKNKKKVDI